LLRAGLAGISSISFLNISWRPPKNEKALKVNTIKAFKFELCPGLESLNPEH